MTRLINTGFETGDITDVINGVGSAVTSQKYTGEYSYYMANNSGKFSIPTPGDVLYLSFFYQPGSLVNLTSFILQDAANANLQEIAVLNTGKVQLTMNGTQIGISTNPVFAADRWHHIEWYAYIANSGGRGVVKVDGTTHIDYTGDTQPGSNVDICSFVFNQASGLVGWMDDLIINDDGGSSPDNTWVGRVRLFPLRPNGNGNYKQWDTSTGGSNYTCVDEVPASGTDYVYTSVDDEIDSYALANLSGIPAGATFKSVIVAAEALVDSGSKKLALGIRSGSTDSFGADKTIGVAYAVKYERFTTDPATATAWTESGINAVEVAIKSRA